MFPRRSCLKRLEKRELFFRVAMHCGLMFPWEWSVISKRVLVKHTPLVAKLLSSCLVAPISTYSGLPQVKNRLPVSLSEHGADFVLTTRVQRSNSSKGDVLDKD